MGRQAAPLPRKKKGSGAKKWEGKKERQKGERRNEKGEEKKGERKERKGKEKKRRENVRGESEKEKEKKWENREEIIKKTGTVTGCGVAPLPAFKIWENSWEKRREGRSKTFFISVFSK